MAEKQRVIGCYQHICRTTTHARVFQTNIPFCPLTPTMYHRILTAVKTGSESMWRYIQGYSMHMWTQNSLTSSLWICKDQPPKLHGTERTVTKTNVIAKSAENTSFCNSSSFLLSLNLSLNINPFFSQIVALSLFYCQVSCYSKPYFFLHCRCRFYLIFNG